MELPTASALLGALIATAISAMWLVIGRRIYAANEIASEADFGTTTLDELKWRSEELDEALRRRADAIREVFIEIYDTENRAHRMAEEFRHQSEEPKTHRPFSEPRPPAPA